MSQPILDSLTICRSLLTGPQCDALAASIELAYLPLEQASLEDRTAEIHRLRVNGQKFVPTASSLTLEAALSESQLNGAFRSIGDCAAAAWIVGRLGSSVAVDLDQAWIRRQYAPDRYPPMHAPHAWHQDGALGYDFLKDLNETCRRDDLLSMITVWIALSACGLAAPGIELVTREVEALFRPAQLTQPAMLSAFRADEFSRPSLEPGDALLFAGSVLHRTHVTPDMTRDRTSIELRLFAGDRLPSRLAGDRFRVIVL